MSCSESAEQSVNETGFSTDITAALPRLENGVSIDPRWQKPVSAVIAALTYELPVWQFEAIRRAEPGHTFAKYTYFARCETTGNIKIGRSFDPEVRMKQIKAATGNPHTLLATVRGGENESSYHMVFSFHRIEGEWFAPHPDILTEIERLGGVL